MCEVFISVSGQSTSRITTLTASMLENPVNLAARENRESQIPYPFGLLHLLVAHQESSKLHYSTDLYVHGNRCISLAVAAASDAEPPPPSPDAPSDTVGL